MASWRRSAGRSRLTPVVVDQSFRHIRSDELCENLEKGDEQRFDRRRDGGQTVRFDARRDPVQLNGVRVRPADLLHRWMGRFRSEEGASQERAAASLAE
jgi:hypothetical protein